MSMHRELHLDLETYASVSLAKCGVYRYAESPDFEILLFGLLGDGADCGRRCAYLYLE